MANSVLLKAGGYAKFTQNKVTTNTDSNYGLLTNYINNIDETLQDIFKQIVAQYNTLIEDKYPDEADDWKIDLDTKNAININIKDLQNKWDNVLSPDEVILNLLDRLELCDKNLQIIEEEYEQSVNK